MQLTDLPNDVLLHIIDALIQIELTSIVQLSLCNKHLSQLISTRLPLLLHYYAIDNTITIPDIKIADCNFKTVRYASQVDHNWQHHVASTATLLQHPRRKAIPRLVLHRDLGILLLATNIHLNMARFDGNGKPILSSHVKYNHTNRLGRTVYDDITAMDYIPNTHDVIVAHQTGMLERVRITGDNTFKSVMEYTHPGYAIHATSVSGKQCGTIAKYGRGRGRLSLYQLDSPWIEPATVTLHAPPWSVLTSPTEVSSPWIAAGTSGLEAASLYTCAPSHIVHDQPVTLGGNTLSTAAYSMAAPPDISTLSRAHHVAVGFYDSSARLYDLRLPTSHGVLDPTQSFTDPWSEDAVYAIQMGGSTGSYLVTGQSRHSTLRIFDVRGKQTPVTVYACRDSSPIYSLELEHSRLFAATDRRFFVMDWYDSDQRRLPGQSRPQYYKHVKNLQLLQMAGP